MQVYVLRDMGKTGFGVGLKQLQVCF